MLVSKNIYVQFVNFGRLRAQAPCSRTGLCWLLNPRSSKPETGYNAVKPRLRLTDEHWQKRTASQD